MVFEFGEDDDEAEWSHENRFVRDATGWLCQMPLTTVLLTLFHFHVFIGLAVGHCIGEDDLSIKLFIHLFLYLFLYLISDHRSHLMFIARLTAKSCRVTSHGWSQRSSRSRSGRHSQRLLYRARRAFHFSCLNTLFDTHWATCGQLTRAVHFSSFLSHCRNLIIDCAEHGGR